MYNLHPPLAAFPFALFTVVVLLEVIGVIRKSDLSHTIEILLTLAVISVVAAFFSGYQGSEFAQATFAVAEGEIDRHHLLGKWLLFVSIPTLALFHCAKHAQHGKRVFKLLYAVSLAISFALVLRAGYLGAELVFRHGAGVNAPVENIKR